MRSAPEYRQRATECLALVQRVPAADRPALLAIAEAWLALAQAAAQRQITTARTRLHEISKTSH